MASEQVYLLTIKVSKVTDAVKEQVAEWQSHPLDTLYPIVYIGYIVVEVRQSGSVINKAMFLALGINTEGQKELLGMWLTENEGAKCAGRAEESRPSGYCDCQCGRSERLPGCNKQCVPTDTCSAVHHPYGA